VATDNEKQPEAPAVPPIPEPTPQLTEQYYKAHKLYGLFAALLLAWELVGIDLGEDPFPYLDIKLKSPAAAPWVLLALMVYFGFRVTVEWYQCEERRRQLRASKVDFAVSHVIAGFSLFVLLFQSVWQRQFADFVDTSVFGRVVFYVLVFLFFFHFVGYCHEMWKHREMNLPEGHPYLFVYRARRLLHIGGVLTYSLMAIVVRAMDLYSANRAFLLVVFLVGGSMMFLVIRRATTLMGMPHTVAWED